MFHRTHLTRLHLVGAERIVFDAIDTSNLMDYCGLWNLLLLAQPLLAPPNQLSRAGASPTPETEVSSSLTPHTSSAKKHPGGVVLTQYIMGSAKASAHNMLSAATLPYHPCTAKRMAKIMGLALVEAPDPSASAENKLDGSDNPECSEKVLHCTWRRVRSTALQVVGCLFVCMVWHMVIDRKIVISFPVHTR